MIVAERPLRFVQREDVRVKRPLASVYDPELIPQCFQGFAQLVEIVGSTRLLGSRERPARATMRVEQSSPERLQAVVPRTQSFAAFASTVSCRPARPQVPEVLALSCSVVTRADS